MENKPTYEELQAQVEALRDGIGKAREELSCCNVNSAGERLSHLLELTPQQHLSERDAQKGLAGFVAGYSKGWNDFGGDGIFRRETLANQYADSIRKESK